MNIWTFLYNVLIGPLNLFFDMVFNISNKLVSNPGYAIIILSIFINILILPLYNRAEKLQKQQRELEVRIQPGIDHIRKTFRGEERFMMLQTFYRQNGYSPASSLKGAFSLLLEIPFFISAYRLLSGLSILNGQPFGIIKDLGKPDALISIGFLSINILPILMTAINIFSGVVYSKGLRRKDKIQIYGMALVFLVLLYNSPSGLAFYWTLNNIFSLGKNIVKAQLDKRPASIRIKKPYIRKNKSGLPVFMSGLGLSVLIGYYIPTLLVASSPIEFIVPSRPINPVNYILFSSSYAIGLFVVWTGLIYILATNRVKEIMTLLAPSLLIISMYIYIEYLGPKGKFQPNLAFYPKEPMSYESREYISCMLVCLLIITISIIIVRYFRHLVSFVIFVITVALFIDGLSSIRSINNIYDSYNHPEISRPTINLSTTSNNVVVIMLDRALSFRFNAVMDLYPELTEDFDGFTFYPNTASFGAHTNIGAPALWGGYEYIPQNSNLRPDVSLRDKHDESIALMPIIFAENGYDVSVINPTYVGYQEISDISIIDQYDGVNAYYTANLLNPYGELADNDLEHVLERNLFCYGLARSCPIFMSSFIVDGGFYNEPEPPDYAVQQVISNTEAIGYDYLTSMDYWVLNSLPTVTNISNTSQGGAIMLTNNLPHQHAILDEPNYTLEYSVNNSDDLLGNYIGGSDPSAYCSYQLNITSLRQLGNWFNYLKENNCYDNTRIIIAADHGYITNTIPGYRINDYDNLGYFRPLLLVKDFDAHGFNISDELMTNADTPTLAFENLIDSPINPFTGAIINNDYKYDHPLIVSNSHLYSVRTEDGNTYHDEGWFVLDDNNRDVRDANNWTYYDTYEEIPQ